VGHDLTRWKGDRPLQTLILLVGIHSSVLGAAILCAPRLVLGTFGFPTAGSMFFPSQSGIFLLIMGLCYLRSLVEPAFVWAILLSKSLAVVFLLVHLLWSSVPPIIWVAAAGDAGMLVAVGVLLRRHGASRPST
jgi:hypothetical protein